MLERKMAGGLPESNNPSYFLIVLVKGSGPVCWFPLIRCKP